MVWASMSQKLDLEFRVYSGPSLVAPFAAVVAEIGSPFAAPLPSGLVDRKLAKLLPADLKLDVQLRPGEVAFEELAMRLAATLYDSAGPCDLPSDLQRGDGGTARILLGYHDPQAAIRACLSAVRIAVAVFSSSADESAGEEAIAAIARQTVREMKMLQPDAIPRALMRRARARGMPVYAVSPASRTWLYGQGRAGWNFFEVANHRDSYTGSRLARDKFISNQLVSRLGLPGVKHGIAPTVEAAVRIAAHLGFPVVVKPIDLSKGRGVSVNITSVEELHAAFAKATPLSRHGVIVERQVPGDDYRLVAIGGRFQWAIRRLPPRIVGNGENTVAELIDQENGRRSDADVAAGFVYRIRIDEEVHKVLAKQGLGIEDRPAEGAVIDLRSNANTATGGTLSDCTADVHPDNREMVEAIARNFHLDAIGIDFITADISESWRELDCGVIEVNSTPGFSSDDRAETILADKFPDGADGRLPSVVVIGDDSSLLAGVSAAFERHVGCVGRTDAAETRIGGYLRCGEGDTLADRVRALVLDASCDALVIGATAQEIERHGFPLDRCDLALVCEAADAPAAMRELVDACAGTVVSGVSVRTLDGDALSTIEAIASRSAGR